MVRPLKRGSAMRKDLYAEVTARIVAQLEAGTAPWVKPWHVTAGRNMPHNAITGRQYSGANVIMLWMAMNRPGFVVPAFATFNQVKKAGGTVRKGEHGSKVYFVKPLESKKDVDAKGNPKRFMMLREFTVFNIAQCDGLPVAIMNPAQVAPRNEESRDVILDSFVATTGATVRHGGDRAFYMPSADLVQMPDFEAFTGATPYYQTLIHELSHWTGHESRLARDFSDRFGNEAYAAEELVAELCAAFISAEFGIDGELHNNASYIASWIKVLKDDSKAFFHACSKAQAAADFLRQKALAEEAAEEIAA
jgi:antirestriction protein ArdC